MNSSFLSFNSNLVFSSLIVLAFFLPPHYGLAMNEEQKKDTQKAKPIYPKGLFIKLPRPAPKTSPKNMAYALNPDAPPVLSSTLLDQSPTTTVVRATSNQNPRKTDSLFPEKKTQPGTSPYESSHLLAAKGNHSIEPTYTLLSEAWRQTSYPVWRYSNSDLPKDPTELSSELPPGNPIHITDEKKSLTEDPILTKFIVSPEIEEPISPFSNSPLEEYSSPMPSDCILSQKLKSSETTGDLTFLSDFTDNQRSLLENQQLDSHNLPTQSKKRKKSLDNTQESNPSMLQLLVSKQEPMTIEIQDTEQPASAPPIVSDYEIFKDFKDFKDFSEEIDSTQIQWNKNTKLFDVTFILKSYKNLTYTINPDDIISHLDLEQQMCLKEITEKYSESLKRKSSRNEGFKLKMVKYLICKGTVSGGKIAFNAEDEILRHMETFRRALKENSGPQLYKQRINTCIKKSTNNRFCTAGIVNDIKQSMPLFLFLQDDTSQNDLPPFVRTKQNDFRRTIKNSEENETITSPKRRCLNSISHSATSFHRADHHPVVDPFQGRGVSYSQEEPPQRLLPQWPVSQLTLQQPGYYFQGNFSAMQPYILPIFRSDSLNTTVEYQNNKFSQNPPSQS